MTVLKYRDPGTGNWVALERGVGPTGPAGPTGPVGEDGYTYTSEEADQIWLRIDGGNHMNAALDAGGHTLTNTAAGTDDTDAATVAQLPDPIVTSPVQVAAGQPAPRGQGDLWTDSSAPVLEWDTVWTPLTLTGGWVRWSDHSFAEPAYRMLPGGVVELRGVIGHSTATTATVFANLPAGYRCATGQQAEYVQLCNGGAALIVVTSTLKVYGYLAGNGTWLSLAGVKYVASA